MYPSARTCQCLIVAALLLLNSEHLSVFTHRYLNMGPYAYNVLYLYIQLILFVCFLIKYTMYIYVCFLHLHL